MDHYIILLVDRKHGHFYRYHENDLQALAEIVDDDVPKSVKGASWKGLADGKIARHVEAHVDEHYRGLIQHLEKFLADKDHAGAEIILGGPEAELASFVALLPNQINERVIAQIHPEHYVGIKELEEQIIQAVAQVAVAKAGVLVEEIENHRGPGGRGVVGREPVYEALNLKEVQTLLIDEHADWSGKVCPTDGSLVASSDKCPICLGSVKSVEDFRTAIDELAAAQDAEIISLPHDVKLPSEYEGIAATKRFTH